MSAPFHEIADRVFLARQEWLDLNITLVEGEAGLLVVDTHASAPAAREVRRQIRDVSAREVVAVVNTHEHFDHTFGNAEFAPAPVHAHEVAAARTVAAGEGAQAEYAARGDDPRAAEVLATTIAPASQTFSSARVIDLGDRQVELIHPGRGHTAGDLVVRVPDADVVVAGDLLEESGPPAYGDDSHPLEWPATLDLVIALTTATTVLVPGHGAVVDQDFAQEQRAAIGVVAETIRSLAGSGVGRHEALAQGDWPYPEAALEHAVARGYEHLPRQEKGLPLI